MTFKRSAILPAALVLAMLSASMAAPGCAQISKYLPTAITYTQDALIILDTISTFVDAVFVLRPNPELKKKIDVAEARARSALSLALRVANGATDLTQAQLDEAFNEFRLAYIDLLALVGPLGVSSGGPRMAATPGGGLVVPEPLAMLKR